MTTEQENWVKALRSGQYKQCRSRLVMGNNSNTYSYCCLGVACAIDENKFSYSNADFSNEILGDKLATKLGIDTNGMFKKPVSFKGKDYSCLTTLNDSGEATFNDIADIIERSFAEQNFVEPDVS